MFGKKNPHYYSFQEYVSQLIPLDRQLPDWRDPWCLEEYPASSVDSLPATSVIVCFHNEARSTLLRTLHSVMDRSPSKLLREVLLLDDASDMEHLGGDLERELKENPKFKDKVRLVRLGERHGLMRCRLRGVSEASPDAPVLTFLDSHVEAGHGWLEPLLHRLREDPALVACPVIDAVNDTSFYYQFVERDLYGLMNWRLEFEWHHLPEDLVLLFIN